MVAGFRRGKDDRKGNTVAPLLRVEASAHKQQQQHFVLQIFICKLVWKNEAVVDFIEASEEYTQNFIHTKL